MRVFISGGCKNGKSYYAQRIAKAMGTPLYYIATMIPHDEEDEARIRRHLRERDGWGFRTIECGLNIEEGLKEADPSGAYLLDSVTALLSNEMFAEDYDPDAPARLEKQLRNIVRRLENIVLVSDYIYSDALQYDEWTLSYRRGLARLDRMLAQECDCVLEVCAGNVICWKGEKPL